MHISVCRKMYGELLCSQNFQQKCQCWMELLDIIEAGLSNQMSGNCAAVREQLAAHQVEHTVMKSNRKIFSNI